MQPKLPLVKFEAVSSCPVICYLREESDPHLATTSFEVIVKSDKVFPETLPPGWTPQCSQLLLIKLVVGHNLHQLHCPSLDMCQHQNVLPVVIHPELDKDSRCGLSSYQNMRRVTALVLLAPQFLILQHKTERLTKEIFCCIVHTGQSWMKLNYIEIQFYSSNRSLKNWESSNAYFLVILKRRGMQKV